MNGKYKSILYCVYRLIYVVSAFNIDTRNSIIYEDPTKYLISSEQSSYFGFSVFLVPGDNTKTAWLQIGAPRGSSPFLRYKNPGVVFRCEIAKPCKYIQVEKVPSATSKLDGAWIGASMDVNFKYGKTVVCAPRWISQYRVSNNENDYRMLGACYWANLKSEDYHKRIPLRGTSADYVYKDKFTNESVYNWGQGEAGIAVHLPEEQDEMFIGAPGVFNWKGTTMLYKTATQDYNPVANKYTVLSNDVQDPSDIFTDSYIANARLSGNLESFGYYGYSVTTGRFYNRRVYYAAGAPRSQNYRGQVLISLFSDKHDQKLNVRDTKEGSQFGEYFGAALAAGDINQDGFDDLFVGAPFYHANSKYNEGRIYLYLGSSKGFLQDPVNGKTIDGTYTKGQFGSAITYLGDMNKDGNRYVAVAAPYADENAGVVYIYKGQLDLFGLDTNPVQKIEGRTFLPTIKGFGMSISKPADSDNNGYKDIAVGAYLSGHVVLLRSKPLIVLNTYFSHVPKSISAKVNEFIVVLCHEYRVYRGMDRIRITRKVLVDKNFNRAKLVGKEDSEPLELKLSQKKCENLTIRLHDIKSRPNIYDPLIIAATHYLVEETREPSMVLVSNTTHGEDNFCIPCGVYDEFRSRKTVEESIPFSLGCRNDTACVSELNFNASFVILGKRTDTFIRGSTNVIDLEIDVNNSGENAYLLNVKVDLPKGMSFKKRPQLCVQNQTTIKCPLKNPLGEGEMDSEELKLDMEYVNQKIYSDFLNINITVVTNSINKNQATKTVTLYLRSEADISINGKSGEQSYAYGNVSNTKVEFEQTYLIGKSGLSPVNSISYQINIPYAIQTKNDNITFISLYQPVGLLDGKSLVIQSQLPILVENKIESSEGILSDKIGELRAKRQVTNSDVELLYDMNMAINLSNIRDGTIDKEFVGTKTFEIDCEREDILCSKVYGSAGPFEGTKNSAVIQLRLVLDVKNLTEFIPKNAIIKYSTMGIVRIKDPPNLNQSGTRPDEAIVSSIFLNDTIKKKIDLWIIIASVVTGFILLLLLTLVLTKAGFFKRAKKEELEHLKAQTGYNNGQTNNADMDGGHTPESE